MNKKLLCFLYLLLPGSITPVLAQGPPQPSSLLDNAVAQVLLAVIFGLFIAIAVLGNVVIQAMPLTAPRSVPLPCSCTRTHITLLNVINRDL